MSVDHETSAYLEFDLADRMRRALRISDVGVQEMADYLGVTRNSVSNWINGRIVPSRQTLRLWSLRTGVPLGWLQNGEIPAEPKPSGEKWAQWESNPQPAVSTHSAVIPLFRTAAAA